MELNQEDRMPSRPSSGHVFPPSPVPGHIIPIRPNSYIFTLPTLPGHIFPPSSWEESSLTQAAKRIKVSQEMVIHKSTASSTTSTPDKEHTITMLFQGMGKVPTLAEVETFNALISVSRYCYRIGMATLRGLTPLQQKKLAEDAAKRACAAILKPLLDISMKPDSSWEPDSSWLLDTIEDKHRDVVELLVNSPFVDVNFHGNVNFPLGGGVDDPLDWLALNTTAAVTPFIIAAQFGSMKVARILARAGAEVNEILDYSNGTVLSKIASLMFTMHNASELEENQYKNLLKAHYDRLKACLKIPKVDMEICRFKGMTTLMTQVENITKIPLSFGKEHVRHTVFLETYALNSLSLLIEAKANIVISDHFGVTPLMLAAKSGYVCMIKTLLEGIQTLDANPKTIEMMRQALLDARNNEGETAIMLAKKHLPPQRSREVLIELEDEDEDEDACRDPEELPLLEPF